MPEDSGLGLCLFTQSGKQWYPMLVSATFVLMFLSYLDPEGGSWIIGWIYIFGVPLLLLTAIALAFSRFQLFEHGIRKRSLLGKWELRYSEIESYSFHRKSHYHRLPIIGKVFFYTSYKIKMILKDGDRALRIAGAARCDEDVDAVEEHTTSLLAGRHQ